MSHDSHVMRHDYLKIARVSNREASGVQNQDTYYLIRFLKLLKVPVILALHVLDDMNTQVAQFPHAECFLVMKARHEMRAKTPVPRC